MTTLECHQAAATAIARAIVGSLPDSWCLAWRSAPWASATHRAISFGRCRAVRSQAHGSHPMTRSRARTGRANTWGLAITHPRRMEWFGDTVRHAWKPMARPCAIAWAQVSQLMLLMNTLCPRRRRRVTCLMTRARARTCRHDIPNMASQWTKRIRVVPRWFRCRKAKAPLGALTL